MNPEDLQKQIDERCPGFAKPLNECNCKTDELPKVKLGKSLLREAYVPPEDFKRVIPRKPQSFA